MNGFELAEMMRGTEKTRHIPIVFVSAAGRELNYAFKGYESGAVDFLHKPLDVHAVNSKVNVFVDLYRQRKALKQRDRSAGRRRTASRRRCCSSCSAPSANWSARCACATTSCRWSSHELRTPLNTLFLETQLRKLHLAKGNAGALRARPAARDGRARRAADPEHGAPDRRHARRVAHAQRHAVDPAQAASTWRRWRAAWCESLRAAGRGRRARSIELHAPTQRARASGTNSASSRC